MVVKEKKFVGKIINNMLTVNTPLINGWLEHICVYTDKRIKIEIFIPNIDSNDGTLIYKSRDLEGEQRLVLREKAINEDGEVFGFSAEKYALMEPLHVIMQGLNDTSVMIKIRYTEE